MNALEPPRYDLQLPENLTWPGLLDTTLVNKEERAKICNNWKSLDTHRSFFAAIDKLKDGHHNNFYMPFDVRVVCKDQKPLDFHKFILLLHSDFFRLTFTYKSASSSLIDVDLTHFSFESVSLLREWMYSGELPGVNRLCASLCEMLLLGNYLAIQFVVDVCGIAFKALVAQGYIDDNGVMLMYFLAGRLGERNVQSISANFFNYFHVLPENFMAIDMSHFYLFISRLDYSCTLLQKGDRCPRTMLRCITSCAGLPALPRERYILDLVVQYICYNKKERLPFATLLLKLLRLAYIAKELDFSARGLEELNDEKMYCELHELLKLCSVEDDFDFYSSMHNIPSKYWAPRPTSIRYSLWSKMFGNFHVKVKNLFRTAPKAKSKQVRQKKQIAPDQRRDAGIDQRRSGRKRTEVLPQPLPHSEDEDIDENNNDSEGTEPEHKEDKIEYKFRRFCFERSQEHRITQIDIFSKLLQSPFAEGVDTGSNTIIGGMRFHWSDGTTDEAGHTDEKDMKSAKFDPYEGLFLYLEMTPDSSDFVERISFNTCEPRHEQHIGRTTPVPKGKEYKLNHYGAFGRNRPGDMSGRASMLGELLGQSVCRTMHGLLIYFDGLKGTEVTRKDTGEKVISGLSFKHSIQTNDSLAHIVKRQRKRKSGEMEDATLTGQDQDARPTQVIQNIPRLNYKEVEMYPRSLTINYLKRDENPLKVTQLRDAFLKQDRQLVRGNRDMFFPGDW